METHTVQTVGSQSLAALWQDFHRQNAAPDVVPAGAITINGYAKMFNLTRGSARWQLESLTHAGKLIEHVYRIKVGPKVTDVKHYLQPARSARTKAQRQRAAK